MIRTRDFLPKHARIFSLAERLLAFPPRHGVMAPAIAAFGSKRSVEVTFLPTITDPATLADLVYRASWYLSPVRDRLKRVTFPVAAGLDFSGGLPGYMDD